jgi:glycosyltransferase involved in cell wall biosynthesis
LHRQKGLDLLVEAIEPLLARYPEMRCCLVGEGPLRETLQSVEERLGRDRFRLLGWRRDAVAMIKACRLLVLPSRYEGMPNVVLEAMAVGKPIAATRVEGVSELLGDNALYQTTLPEDPFAFAALVEDLWVNPTASQILAEQNRTRAAESFSVPQLVDRYETLYRSLLC